MVYDFNEYKHRFAVWTAARAVQRRFIATKCIKAAIEKTGLRAFCASKASISADQFDELQETFCRTIMHYIDYLQLPLNNAEDKNSDELPDENSNTLQQTNKSGTKSRYATCSYRRASKIVAIYLKTALIIPGKGKSVNCNVIHPLIDSVLLKKFGELVPVIKKLKSSWTNYTLDDYRRLKQLIRDNKSTLDLNFNWKLEEHWNLEGHLVGLENTG